MTDDFFLEIAKETRRQYHYVINHPFYMNDHVQIYLMWLVLQGLKETYQYKYSDSLHQNDR